MEKQTNREHVVVVASDLFIRRGIANTSMDDVVRESGVAKSNIYYHFKSKDELLIAVAEHHISEYHRTVIAPVMRQRGDSVIDTLKALIISMTAELEGRGCVGGCAFMTMAIQVSGTNPAVKERIARYFAELTAKLETMLAYAALRGEIRQDVPPEEAAGLLMSAIEGSLFLAEVSHDSGVLQRRALLLLELLRPIS